MEKSAGPDFLSAAAAGDPVVDLALQHRQRQRSGHQHLGMEFAKVEAIAQRAPLVPKNYREQLMKRLRDAGLELDLNDERVLREIALFADRCDVSEELTRLRSHLEQFTTLLRSEAEIGRKAEFILQEIGR